MTTFHNSTAENKDSLSSKKSFMPYVWIIVALVLGFGVWLKHSPIAGATDVRVHVRLAHTYFVGMVDSLSLPDWDAKAYGGRGTPMLRFIGPLPFLFTSLLQLFGATPAMAIKITLLLFAFFGLLGLKRLLEESGCREVFAALALFFVLQPVAGYHFGVTLIFPNICAHFLSPWLWLGALQFWQGKRHSLLFSALIMGAMAWTHLLYVLMVGYLWVMFMLTGLLRKESRRFIAGALLVPLMAIALAAPYILPAFFTRSEVHYEITANAFQPGKTYCEFLDEPVLDSDGNAFSFLASLALIGVAPDKRLNMPPGATGLQVISSAKRNSTLRPWLLLTVLVTILMALAGQMFSSFRAERKAFPGFEWLLPGGFAAFMTLSLSEAIHYVLPGATSLQFPFRWALPAVGVLTPLIALSIKGFAAKSFIDINRSAIWLSRIALLILLFAGLYLQTQYWTLPQSSLDNFFRRPGHLQPFYPRAVADPKKIPLIAGDPHQLALSSGTAQIYDYEPGITTMHCRINASAAIELNIKTHYDPFWQLTAASKPLAIRPAADDGTIVAEIQPGSWLLELTRRTPAGRNNGWLIMLATLLLMRIQFKSSKKGQANEHQ